MLTSDVLSGGNTPYSLPHGWGVAEIAACLDEDDLDDTADDLDIAWDSGEPEIEEDYDFNPADRSVLDVSEATLSQFAEIAFRMPRADGAPGFEPFTFEGRKHMRRIYDTPARRVLLICARQVEKSTCLGNRAVSYSCIVPGFRTLYVSPTSTQTKTFSNDRINEPIQTSSILRAFTTTMLSANVFEKRFVNFSTIVLRNAFLNADRTRGIPAWQLLLDEFQDLLSDNIPIIEQCTSHAPDRWKMFCYSGTPKSLDNNIELYRSGYVKGLTLSTQGEWVVPCDSCGSADGSGRYWNILGEKNIGKKSLICESCGKPINPQHDDAQWAMQVEDAVFESYRISQLMVPWKPWPEILLDYERYPRDKFYNEVLGLSYDSGMRPLTKAQVKACCDPKLTMHPDRLEEWKVYGRDNPIFMGLDWGTGENSYTVMTLGTYVGMQFTIFYVHRFIGQELEPPLQLRIIRETIDAFNVLLIGADYGGGFSQNDDLTRAVGPARLTKYQYMARCKRKVEYEPKLRRYKVFRTEVMSDIFNAIKRKQLTLPRFEEFKEPYAQDMCNIFSEYNETLRMTQYSHRQDRPDDTFHSILYCFLASMIKFRRPDIIAALKEDPHSGPNRGGWSGPTFQGLALTRYYQVVRCGYAYLPRV